jgi:hypothetical protein
MISHKLKKIRKYSQAWNLIDFNQPEVKTLALSEPLE